MLVESFSNGTNSNYKRSSFPPLLFLTGLVADETEKMVEKCLPRVDQNVPGLTVIVLVSLFKATNK